MQDTYIVFRDLSDAYTELMANNSSLLAVRRNLKNFLNCSFQLTEIMRKEYRRRTGKTWEPINFTGWDDISDTFKQFRNAENHRAPVLVLFNVKHFISINKIFGDSSSSNYHYIVLEGTYDTDPFSDYIPDPDNLKVILADEKTGEPSDKIVKPDRTEYTFVLVPRTDETKKYLDKIKNNDLFELSKHYFKTLQDYYNFYEKSVQENENKSGH